MISIYSRHHGEMILNEDHIASVQVERVVGAYGEANQPNHRIVVKLCGGGHDSLAMSFMEAVDAMKQIRDAMDSKTPCKGS